MPKRPDPTDLRGRRQALGLSLNAMAHGLGLRVADITEIEDGKASDASRNHYARWLSIIEDWPEDRLLRQGRRAEEGHRFG